MEVVERFFAALEAGDTATLASIYSADARIWHNDGTEDDVESNLKVLRGLHGAVSGLHYEILRRLPAGGGVFQQHTLRGRLPDDRAVALPAAMYLAVEAGRITRIEEYLDSAQAAPIRAARGAAAG